MLQPRSILAIVRKDLRDLKHNYAVLLSLVAPILLSLLFVRIAAQREHPRIKVATLRAAPAELLEHLDGCAAFEVRLEASAERVRSDVERGVADLGIEVAPDLVDSLEEHQRPEVRVYARQDRGPLVAAGLSALVEIMRAVAQQPAPVQVDLVAIGASEERVLFSKLVASWLLFAMLVGFTVVAVSLIEEREKGTLQAILVTSTTVGSVMAAKALVGFLITFSAGAALLLLQGGQATSLATWQMLAAGTAFVVAAGLAAGTMFHSLAAANAGLSLGFLCLFVPVYLADLEASGRWVQVVRWMPSWAVQHGLQQALQGAPEPMSGLLGLLGLWTCFFGVAARQGARHL